MTKKKTDLEQLKGILEQFSPDVIQEAVAESMEGAYCQKSYKDFDDPGPEVQAGTESAVPLEELPRMERLIAENNLLPVHFLEEGAVVQKAVARVTLKQSYAGLPAGKGWGTGFLVSRSLFMTNNHVIPNQDFARNTVEMQFNYQLDYSGTPQVVDTYQADPDSVFYTNSALDFTLVRLSPKYRDLLRRVGSEAISPQEEIYGFAGEEASALGSAFSSTVSPYTIRFPYRVPFRIRWDAGSTWGHLQLRPSISYALDQRVNIIQHPKGRRKELAIHQNTITNIYTSRIRYKTDTEPGSSGSPVFNNGWDLIAIHHAAGEKDPITGAWVNNEGMRIDKIVADLRNHYQGSTTGAQILTELGI